MKTKQSLGCRWIDGPAVLVDGNELLYGEALENSPYKAEGAEAEAQRNGTMAWQILKKHTEDPSSEDLRIRFDSITSHDITYVGIIQTARASGMKRFPIPYVLTNCHNSLCAVGGTINEDDHKFALSAAKKYGGIYVPANQAVIHTYNREMMTGVGRMILGSDSHTRYGALGTLAVGEGGGELAKQLLSQTYDFRRPEVCAVYLTGKPCPGVGPQDIALAMVKTVFDDGLVKNKVLEFVGDGIEHLPVEYRNGIDVMTTETTCWSSIWRTDERVRRYYENHGRPEDFAVLSPEKAARYDCALIIDMSQVEPLIALPYHPSNVFTIRELKENPYEIFKALDEENAKLFEASPVRPRLVDKIHDGKIYAEQGVIVGCSGGTFDNIAAAADIVEGHSIGNGAFSFSLYPGSGPIYLDLVRQGIAARLLMTGALMKSAFCGPCFGAGDTPANNELSIRHATRNFPNRDGSKPGEGQISLVALMDARSIAATAVNGGYLTGADELDVHYTEPEEHFDPTIYENRVFNGWGHADDSVELVFGPNIKDWPEMPALTDHLLVKVASSITDPVTTTDELIPSGETSSYRSNPHRLAEFTLGRKDPAYVGKAKAIRELELERERGEKPFERHAELGEALKRLAAFAKLEGVSEDGVGIGSAIFAIKPGDGSAREQAASNQKVLGGWANLVHTYATKRYRSNLINWGILPFEVPADAIIPEGAWVFVPSVREQILSGASDMNAYVLDGENIQELPVSVGYLSDRERRILAAGCLINDNRG